MKIIGYRKNGIDIMYIFTTVLGIISCVSGLYLFNKTPVYPLFLLIVGIFLILLSLVILIGYYKTPREAIKYDEHLILQLPKGVEIKINQITHVSYQRASARGAQYRWGSVVITTRDGSYKIRYLANCETVCNELTKLQNQAERKM